MNLVGYIRVSGMQQVEEGAGLEIQENAIREWCAREGHELLSIYSDEGISGAEDELNRRGLAHALVATEDIAEGLVVWKLDRLARDLIIQETICSQLGRRGRRLFSTLEDDIDSSNPTRVLVRQLLGIISQYEKAIITMRLQAGRALKASKGGYAYGAPRFGSRAHEGELVIDEAEQRTIARMAELNRQGRSLRYIVATLTLEGHRPKRGGAWHTETVRRVLQRLEAA